MIKSEYEGRIKCYVCTGLLIQELEVISYFFVLVVLSVFGHRQYNKHKKIRNNFKLRTQTIQQAQKKKKERTLSSCVRDYLLLLTGTGEWSSLDITPVKILNKTEFILVVNNARI